MVTNQQVKCFFQDKRDVSCPIINELIINGYQQEEHGYIAIAKAASIQNPSQWWHLMNYLLIKEEQHQEDDEFCQLISCGELIFWMAEASKAVEREKLIDLKNRILLSKDISNRKKWNQEIKALCWDPIMERIKNTL